MPCVEPFPFQKALTRIRHLWVSNSLCMMWPCYIVARYWKKSLLSAKNSNRTNPCWALGRGGFSYLGLQQSMMRWSWTYSIGGGKAVVWGSNDLMNLGREGRVLFGNRTLCASPASWEEHTRGYMDCRRVTQVLQLLQCLLLTSSNLWTGVYCCKLVSTVLRWRKSK